MSRPIVGSFSKTSTPQQQIVPSSSPANTNGIVSMASVFETPLTNRMKRDIEEIFDLYDTDRKGFLTKIEYKLAYISLMGHKPSKFERKELFSSSRPVVRKQFFMELMSRKLMRSDQQDRIREIFNTIDSERKGFITLQDLTRSVSMILNYEKQFGKGTNSLSNLALESLLTEFDIDRANRISYTTFCSLILKNNLTV